MLEKKVDNRRTITLRLTPEEHKALKVFCANEDVKMQKWIEKLICEKIKFDGGERMD